MFMQNRFAGVSNEGFDETNYADTFKLPDDN